MKLRFLYTIVLLIIPILAGGRNVRDVRATLTQPDGTTFEGVLNGDEALHFLTDSEGHAIIKAADCTWYYAYYGIDGTLCSSGYAVGKPAPATVLAASLRVPMAQLRMQAMEWRRLRESLPSGIPRRKAVRSKADGESEGGGGDVPAPRDKHSLILLVQFSDDGGKMRYTRNDFVDLITLPGYNRGGAIGSASDYFNEMFEGDCVFHYEISEIITLDNPSKYYFDNENGPRTQDKAADLAVMEACRKAHDEQGIDFSSFDDNGDGEVDNVFLFVAGRDEADCLEPECVWSHMFYLEASKKNEVKEFYRTGLDGVRVNNYAISTELRRLPNRYDFTGIGTFCHEYSHTLDLPDCYDTDYEGSGGYGNGLWRSTALMDGGNANNYFTCPPHYNAIDYDIIGIGCPETLTEGSWRLEPISQGRRYLKLESGNPGEYYLFECRDNNRWDQYIGGKGLLVYHLDKSNSLTGRSDTYGVDFPAYQRWDYNEVNCRPDHECARLVSATPGLRYYSGSSPVNNQNLIFFPCDGTIAFTALTDPPFVFWDGSPSPLALTEIRRDGDDILFTVTRMSDIDVPSVEYDNDLNVFQDAAIIRWSSDDLQFSGPSYISWGLNSGAQEEIEVQPYAPGRYAFTMDGLSPGTAYKLTLFFRSYGITSQEKTVKFTTKRQYDRPYIYLSSAKRNADGSFPSGAEIPLRVFNCPPAESVKWYFDGGQVTTGGNGYFTLTRSGDLKAVISRSDGTTDIILKHITVR